ncbi:hypothetical protein BC937DRAFT_91962 [Endogone sp. FLAS-F59071]|nr:hypothetical protein BC937DRAFT_91962 [Endogone sp. FLAS-F59071]|eukprot:RUS15820.1 hypothetical protein BC937DRAFT_91962 [Endogone sp. FLAS-F59071]
MSSPSPSLSNSPSPRDPLSEDDDLDFEDIKPSPGPDAIMSPTPPSQSSKDTNTSPSLLENVDPNAPPIKIKKKPGRKPNPASPAMRKAQNRVAQRAFRERKERHLRELEDQIKDMRMQRDRAIKASTEFRTTAEAFRVENNYLKNLVITMQTALSQHGIPVPEFGDPNAANAASLQFPTNMIAPNPSYMPVHGGGALTSQMQMPSIMSASPLRYPNPPIMPLPTSKPMCYSMSEDMLMTPTSDYYDDSYVKVPNSPENNPSQLGWNPVLNEVQESNDYPEPPTPGTQALINTLFTNPTDPNTTLSAPSPSLYRPELNYMDPSLPASPHSSLGSPSSFSANSMGSPHISPLPETIVIDANTQIGVPANIPLTQRAAVQIISVQLCLQNASKVSNLPYSIQPTPLQHSVPHDPRIDLLPSKHIRDRMIVFRSYFDLDECFHALINEARFHGGDPAEPTNWELPARFFTDYWFLVVDSDLARTNKWRRIRGEKDLEMKPPEGSYRKLGGGTDPIIDALLQESMSRLSTATQ